MPIITNRWTSYGSWLRLSGQGLLPINGGELPYAESPYAGRMQAAGHLFIRGVDRAQGWLESHLEALLLKESLMTTGDHRA